MTDSGPIKPVVLKLGGSLLDFPTLAEHLADLLDRLGPVPVVLIVGGGRTADEVRRWDTIHRLGDASAHWLAIDAMDFNARLVRSLLQRTGRETTTDLSALRPGVVVIPVVRSLLKTSSCPSLPESWDVTSDAIALWTAKSIYADRVLFLKSADPPADRRISTAVETGLLDSATEILAQGLSIGWVNLRGDLSVTRLF
jgi:aspartokinase-like uncharacterized kinase